MRNRSLLNTILILFSSLMLSFTDVRSQTLIPDEITLEQTVYANLQKGIDEFHGITEKHSFYLEGRADAGVAVNKLLKDPRVQSALFDKKKNMVVIVIKKTTLDESRPWIERFLSSEKLVVRTHELNFYKAD